MVKFVVYPSCTAFDKDLINFNEFVENRRLGGGGCVLVFLLYGELHRSWSESFVDGLLILFLHSFVNGLVC